MMELMAEEGLSPLNDGDATWHARREGCSQKSDPGPDRGQKHRGRGVSWRVAQRLSSDHLPIIID